MEAGLRSFQGHLTPTVVTAATASPASRRVAMTTSLLATATPRQPAALLVTLIRRVSDSCSGGNTRTIDSAGVIVQFSFHRSSFVELRPVRPRSSKREPSVVLGVEFYQPDDLRTIVDDPRRQNVVHIYQICLQDFVFYLLFPVFCALTLSIGRQKEHLACRKFSDD